MKRLVLVCVLSSAALAQAEALEAPAPARATSTQGGAPLGPGRFGVSAMIGFPMIEVRAGVGLGERFDVSLAYDSYYFMSHELGLVARLALFEVSGFRMLLSASGSGAFFVEPRAIENRGARWISGRRNFNASPGVIISYQGEHERAARLSLEARYLLAISTEPGEALLGHNFAARGVAELGLSQRVAFIVALGVTVHLRPEDSVVMPTASVGLSINF
jgi:hypothetical protein